MYRFFCFSLAVATALSAGPALGGAKPAADSRAARTQEASPKDELQGRHAVMSGVKSWAIQLRYIDRTALAAAPFDLIVIDHAPHPQRDIEIPFSAGDIAPLKLKPDGTRRIVLAYLSIGEAERYRYYWKPQWDMAGSRPKWLGAENPRWPGDYAVQFADPDWQAIIFGTQDSYLDRISAAGFDGVYLDRVDAYQDVEDTVPGAEDAMMGFVERLAGHAHRLRPEFLVVMQNAEELAKSKSLLARLDGIAKEDLLYGIANSDAPNPVQMVRDTVANLRKAKRAGLKVLVLEYARSQEAINATVKLAAREGFLLHITDRMLGILSPEKPEPAAPAIEAPAAKVP